MAAGALALALVAVSSRSARADIAYAFAEQSISNLTITAAGGGALPGAISGTATQASAVANGSGAASNNPLDTAPAQVGTSPMVPNNYLTHYSSLTAGLNVLPATPPGPDTGDFTRGDAVITSPNIFTGASASNVAESIVGTSGAGTALFTGQGTWTTSGVLPANQLAGMTALAVNFSFANDVAAWLSNQSEGFASASFKLTISVKDQHGNENDLTPSQVNTAISTPANGNEIVNSGSVTGLVLPLSTSAGGANNLVLTDMLTISITGTEVTAVALSVPEPSSIALGAVAGGLVLATGALRRWKNRRAV
jgi:hypothetical protein